MYMPSPWKLKPHSLVLVFIQLGTLLIISKISPSCECAYASLGVASVHRGCIGPSPWSGVCQSGEDRLCCSNKQLPHLSGLEPWRFLSSSLSTFIMARLELCSWWVRRYIRCMSSHQLNHCCSLWLKKRGLWRYAQAIKYSGLRGLHHHLSLNADTTSLRQIPGAISFPVCIKGIRTVTTS